MSKQTPLRTCLGCRAEKGKESLIRLVAGPDGDVVIDYKGRLPGRGAYVCFSESCVREAFLKKKISGSFKGAGTVGVDEFLALLREKAMDRLASLLSLSRKAGKVVDGREAVEKSLEKGDIKLLLMAEDIASGSYKEMKEKCIKKGVKYNLYFSKGKLGALLGKGERGAVGIVDESFSALLERELDRLRSMGSFASGGEIDV